MAQAVIFGLGSMFNHAMDQNVGWERDTDRLLVTYRSLRDISAGEELCKCSHLLPIINLVLSIFAQVFLMDLV